MEPGYMVSLEEGIPSLAAMLQTIIQQDDEGVEVRVESFVIEAADVLLRSVKQRDKRTAWQLVDWLSDTFFEMIILKQFIKIYADYKDVTTKTTGEVMLDNGSSRVLGRDGNSKKDGGDTLYMRNMTDVPQKQVVFYDKKRCYVSSRVMEIVIPSHTAEQWVLCRMRWNHNSIVR